MCALRVTRIAAAGDIPDDLKAMITEFTNHKVPLFVKSDAGGMIKLTIWADSWAHF
jgi:hypothetical protein